MRVFSLVCCSCLNGLCSSLDIPVDHHMVNTLRRSEEDLHTHKSFNESILSFGELTDVYVMEKESRGEIFKQSLTSLSSSLDIPN